MPHFAIPSASQPIRRSLRLLLAAGSAALALCAVRAQAQGEAPTASPTATPQALYDALLASMKRGSALNFSQRVDFLGPEIRQDLDLALMTRIVVGPPWRSLSPADQRDLTEAFSDYSIATYAQRFRSYDRERFEVDPTPAGRPNGDIIVHTKLFTGGSDFVQLDYLLRRNDGRWRIIDVYLSGTISELAARRSEYSATLRQGGASALTALLRKKAADFGN